MKQKNHFLTRQNKKLKEKIAYFQSFIDTATFGFLANF